MSENLVKSLREVSPKLSLLTYVLDDDTLWLMIKHYRKFTFFSRGYASILGLLYDTQEEEKHNRKHLGISRALIFAG